MFKRNLNNKKNKIQLSRKKLNKYKLKRKRKFTCIVKIKFNGIILKSIFIVLLCFLFYIFKTDPKNVNNFLKTIIKGKSSDLKVALCVVGKKENLYAKEYVNYYKDLGYNHIYIYDNNDLNTEKFEDVLQEEINSSFVSIINVRGKGTPQCYAYKHCYEKNNKNYDWLSFFDFDEFLEVRPQAKNIQDFLSNKRYDKCVNIKINFLFYSDNELLYYDPRPVQQRFTTPLYKEYNNRVIKSTVRGGLPKNYWSLGCTPHTSARNVTSCNSMGEILHPNSGGNNRINYTYAALKHYYTKTVEEYANKSRRGDAYIPIGWDLNRKYYKIKNYFHYNKKTIEKENLFKKLFNIKQRI